MAQTKVIGGGSIQPGVELAVDPTFLAGRVAMRPLEYTAVGEVLGHYSAVQVSGTTITLAAADVVASIRWTDTSHYFVLTRIKVGWACNTITTTTTTMDLSATVLRSFITDYAGNNTRLSLATITNTNKMRASMGTSLMGVLGPQICTTAGMTGSAAVADAAPFALTVWPWLVESNVTGTTLAGAVGNAGLPDELYNWRNFGQHPLVLSALEGIKLALVTAGPQTTGGVKYYVEWSWAEVKLF